jgi:flavin-dependent dehydrogenase
MRDRFDQFLLEKASREGAEILEGERVSEVKERDGGVEVECAKGRRLSCEYLVGADGPGSTVARSVGLPSPKGRGIGLESEVPLGSTVGFPEEEFRLIHLDFGGVPNGYGWVFPKREGLSIGIGGMLLEEEKVKLRQCYTSLVNRLSYLDGNKAVPVLGHLLPSFYEEGQRVARGRVLLVGDAAYLMDPLMGEGIYYALRSGMLAAEAVSGSRRIGGLPSDIYQDAVNRHISGNLKWALGFSRFVFRFQRLAYRSLVRYPELADFYLGVLEGTEDYRGFITKVKERMKDVLKGKLGEKIKKAMGRA